MSQFNEYLRTATGTIMLLLLFTLVMNLPYLSTREFSSEEGRRARVTIEMMENNTWIVPYYQSRIYLNKPPLYNIYQRFFFKTLGGPSEFSARMSSVISAFIAACIISIFWLRAYGTDGWLHVLSGILFLTTFDVIDKTVRAEIDMTFAMLITASYISWFYAYEIIGRKMLAWSVGLVFMVLAVLTKGVQPPVFFYSAVIPYLIYRKEWKELFSYRHFTGIAIATGVFLLWFIPFINEVGFNAIYSKWYAEIAMRGNPVRGDSGFITHFLKFPLRFLKAYLPWLPFLGIFAYLRPSKSDGNINKLAWFCMFALIFTIPLYWVIPGTRLRYILPIAGLFSLLIAISIRPIILNKLSEPKWVKWYIKGFGILIVLIVAGSPLWGGKFDLIDKPVPIFLMLMLLMISSYLIFARRPFKNKLIGLVVLMFVVKVFWASFYFTYDHDHNSYKSRAAQTINSMLPHNEMIYNYRVVNPNLVYYLNRPISSIKGLDNLPSGAFLIARPKAFENPVQLGLTEIGAVRIKRNKIIVYQYGLN